MNYSLLAALGEVNLETLKTVGIVAGILLGLALVIVIAILVVGKVFRVNMDEKVTKILENLAGANCGGCGCSGCAGFAAKLANGTADLSACHVTSPENKAQIAALLGVELKDARRARGCSAATRCAKRPVSAAATAKTPVPKAR